LPRDQRDDFFIIIPLFVVSVPTERTPLVIEVSANFFADRGCHVVSVTNLFIIISLFVVSVYDIIPTERPPLVSEVSANFFADRGRHVVSVTNLLLLLLLLL
jgi:hypothetical protein